MLENLELCLRQRYREAMILSPQNEPIHVVALYKFFALDDPVALREELLRLCERAGIRGTLILAHEGINGTVAGTKDAINGLVSYIVDFAGAEQLEVKHSSAETMPFYRLKVRVKKEIVTLGAGAIDPNKDAGTYVNSADWNSLISDPGTVVIDTRNQYEVELGTFRGAVSPETGAFREFPQWVEDNRENLEGKKIAMFCTGGIRCEKATAYVKSLGIGEVYHLQGGILKYLEEVDPEQSMWDGECFVFDERVSVTHGLQRGEAALCRACRHPLKPEDRDSPHFIEGVSCPTCHNKNSEKDRQRFAQRQRQIELAKKRGERHIGR